MEPLKGLVPHGLTGIRHDKGTELRLSGNLLRKHTATPINGQRLGILNALGIGIEPIDLQHPQGEAQILPLIHIHVSESEIQHHILSFHRPSVLACEMNLGNLLVNGLPTVSEGAEDHNVCCAAGAKLHPNHLSYSGGL